MPILNPATPKSKKEKKKNALNRKGGKIPYSMMEAIDLLFLLPSAMSNAEVREGEGGKKKDVFTREQKEKG